MWNRLHADRKQSTFKTIPYCQKFQKDHVVYLQFTSELSTDVTLNAYDGINQIETFTSSYVTHYGTIDNRYFFNFVVTLDNIYYNKSIYFKAIQGSDELTSEPIYTQDLTEYITLGQIKYIKYTNLDRVESDLDDRFIDWSALTSTGKYLDFFIEAQDVTPNDSDSTEVLEGSQSQIILSSNYYSGKTLKTGAIPDYLYTKLGMVSSLDIFMVNDLQYIKNGEIEIEQYGNSTLYQCSINMTQKNTIGINVDNLGVIETETLIPDENVKMWIGALYFDPPGAPPGELEITTMTEKTAVKENQTIYDDAFDQRYCFAYPATFGSLTSIIDTQGYEVISGFGVSSITIDGTLYTVYTLNRPATVTDVTMQFKF
jgi:hypothetical protein